MKRKYYLEGDLFYKSQGVAGYAQVPHCFTKDHLDLLNEILEKGYRGEDAHGIYYIIDENN